jgi:hypothetical protein
MSEEMIEDVAAAIAISDWPGNEWNIECFSEREQEEYRSRARAAIAAYNPNERLREALEACEAYFVALEESGDKHPAMLKIIRGASHDAP